MPTEKGKKLAVLGAGESGVGTAVLAIKKGWEVFVSDAGKIKEEYKKVLYKYEIEWEEGGHSLEKIMDANLVMKSPGIPDNVEVVKLLRDKNIPVISEIEFTWQYTDAKIIAITGSNGKTTTTLLTYHILRNAGLNVGVAGNVGKSFALQVAENNFEYYVLELSSFQLDGIVKFRPHIAILLNITPDHLDRYDGKMENYIASKFRIAENLLEDDFFIYNKDDKTISNQLKQNKIKGKHYPFSIKEQLPEGGFINEDKLNIKINNTLFTMATTSLALTGMHNTYNSMAAGIASRVIDLRKASIRNSLSDFETIEHRLEFVATVHGIDFINDSKATNINSAWYALETTNAPIVWIAGGVDKGNDYSEIEELIKNKVKAIICLGEDNSKLLTAFSSFVPMITGINSAAEAVQKAYDIALKGDKVLLAPACSSFDLFEDYKDRGQKFKAAVKQL